MLGRNYPALEQLLVSNVNNETLMRELVNISDALYKLRFEHKVAEAVRSQTPRPLTYHPRYNPF